MPRTPQHTPAKQGRTAPQRPRPPATAAAAPAPQGLLQGAAREALIQARAYALYERNGRVDGRALEDWLSAEADVDRMVLEGVAPLEPAP